ncbi:hypothetical protein LUZ63_016568 [Rhynchospora breviuscula]|uniref:Replication factor A C-terminal domain-containing protein n=1 Tax=Rhynchospora breviuscula TaxID=2022672 RepID=A0A9P9ZA69_9POAL|nr:hypothetical protein LUZ63_016568 [Rhynchospora breviuscula]
MFNRNAPIQALLPRPNPIRVTLGDLNALYLDNFTESLYECAAQITHIINPFDWCYRACTECHKKLDQTTNGLYCGNCYLPKKHFIPWYRIRVHVRDRTGAAEFVLLGKTGDMIVGTDAVTLKAAQDRQEGNRAAPTLLAILNKAYLFTISGKQPGGYKAARTYTVTRHEQVPEDMIDLLPDPILLLQYPPTQQKVAIPPLILTLVALEEQQNTPHQPILNIPDTTEKTPQKRCYPI